MVTYKFLGVKKNMPILTRFRIFLDENWIVHKELEFLDDPHKHFILKEKKYSLCDFVNKK